MTTEKSRREYAKYHSSREAKRQRAARNKARRQAIREGRVSKGDGKEIDHKRPLSQGGSNSKSNQRVTSRTANRRRGAKLISKSAAARGGRRSSPKRK